MGDFTIFSPEFLVMVGNFAPIIIFFAVFCLGEFAVLSAFIIATQVPIGLLMVFTASLVGTLCADLFWFGVGRMYPAIQESKIYKVMGLVYRKQEQFFLRYPGLIIFAINYVYAFRWSTIIFYSSTAMTLKRYLLLDTIGSAAYILVLGTIGYLTGTGIYNLVPVYDKVTQGIFAIVFVVFVVFMLRLLGRAVFKRVTHITNG